MTLSSTQPDQRDHDAGHADAVLRFENVRKNYGEHVAVRNSTFDIRKGEILTLLGPSGCGKTTTLRMAIGLERANAGRIWFRNRLVEDPQSGVFFPPEKREMGMVFQSYAIWPHLNVFENVAYPLRARGRPAAEIRDAVYKVLELVGLKGFEERRSTMLSGGQQQRVAVSRALVFGPDLLLMDEPFSNLDAKLRDQMRLEVKLLQRRLGISVLFVTHDQSEALALSDRLAVMQNGVMEQVGTPEALYNEPGTTAVRDFLGRTVLMPGTLEQIDGAGQPWVMLEEGVRVRVGGKNHFTGSTGQPCMVGVRPEQVAVAPADGATNQGAANEGALQARILTLLFLGNCYESTIELKSGRLITVALPAAAHWHEKQLVTVRLPEERMHLWPAGESAGESAGAPNA